MSFRGTGVAARTEIELARIESSGGSPNPSACIRGQWRSRRAETSQGVIFIFNAAGLPRKGLWPLSGRMGRNQNPRPLRGAESDEMRASHVLNAAKNRHTGRAVFLGALRKLDGATFIPMANSQMRTCCYAAILAVGDMANFNSGGPTCLRKMQRRLPEQIAA